MNRGYEMIEEMKLCPISELEEWISNNEKSYLDKYDQLLQEAERYKKRADECEKMKSKVSIISQRFSSNADFLKLLQYMGGSMPDIDNMNRRLSQISLGEVLGNEDIDVWIANTKGNRIHCIEIKGTVVNITLKDVDKIQDITGYVNELYSLYTGTRDEYMYERCMRKLLAKKIVACDFKPITLKADYRNFASQM